MDIGTHLTKNIDLLLHRGLGLLGDGSSDWLLVQLDNQMEHASVRSGLLSDEGLTVPPFMIMSITRRCNLNCAGCYSRKLHNKAGEELDDELYHSILDQAEDLGIGIILTAGGEPLLRDGIIDLLGEHERIIFPLFTNGMLLDDEKVGKLAECRNIVPVLSIEGFQGNTDVRRGDGVLSGILDAASKLKEKDIFWGTSITFTSENIGEIASDYFVSRARDLGCRLFIFVEYVPVEEGTENLVPDDDQRELLREAVIRWSDEKKGLFISFPDDEEAMGGCISSGRGFVHINYTGDLEPCPFAPYSDSNLRDMSLKEALGSDLLRTIRENGERLEETSGGCALWRERNWLRSLL